MNSNLRLLPLLAGLIGVVAFIFYGCQEGPFGRRQLVTISPQQEAALGAQAFQEVLQKSDVVSSGPVVDAVRQIGRRLATAADQPEFRRALHLNDTKFDWDFRVVRSKQVNAFCLPGGKVVVYTGILPVCQTEGALAAVMGHEIGHALARHGAERMAQQQAVQIAETAAAASLGDMDPDKQREIMGLLGAGASVGVLLPFSRKHESEADHIGVLMMAAAGYDPSEAAEFWQRMEKQTGTHTPEFLSTHPSHATRIQEIRGWLPEAQKFYEQSVPQRSRPLPLTNR
jgi:predicted Zn-dependent protease